ncbi:uncharacterized protein LOC142633026 [Castanea sativa]|uniref:uncharacterized protein LOC142633026 n=1 Tax=Castanea sativa TaxID=21020 RepID=UPI003F65081E
MSCVYSSSISILFNGGATESFLPSRGIRQGDPLSLYLFIFCMEVLGAMIAEKCCSKLWNPVKASQGGLPFSHLFFTDDLVLFARVDWKNCVDVREVLDSFCELSGQKSTPSLGKYLGFPIKHSGTLQDFGYILERVQGRLAGWKANLLSFAGRLVLTQAVTSTIPNYAMQCGVLPAKILSNVDRLSRNFI